MLPEDRLRVVAIIKKTEMFSKSEIKVAIELIDIFLKNKKQKDYIIYVSENNNVVSGYVCFGPSPATTGTFDLYWIAVSPEFQNLKIGTGLLKFVEKKVREKKAGMLIIETSSRKQYEPTQNFYLRNDYIVEAKIRDFYSKGDDKMIFIKRFQ